MYNLMENGGTNNAEIIVPLKYLSNVWRNFEYLLIYCEINLILAWPANCLTTSIAADKAT